MCWSETWAMRKRKRMEAARMVLLKSSPEVTSLRDRIPNKQQQQQKEITGN
jgi:hypothetical protein